ncbi:TlpA family protein disulfide reductase, partial [Mycobacterium tuberculosis]|nr:TlpA family protein disulfide reductase [Mycobacterium tuberculosis]
LPDVAEQPLDLRARFAGRPLLINVWASWCAPCVEEMPELARFAEAQGVQSAPYEMLRCGRRPQRGWVCTGPARPWPGRGAR